MSLVVSEPGRLGWFNSIEATLAAEMLNHSDGYVMTQRVRQRLIAAHLDRQIEAKHETRSLPDLLLAKGSMSGPFRRTNPAISFFRRLTLAMFTTKERA